ncbi:winged helix-turn-helix transcriptional regulator [Chitinophaga sp. Hz27]|uniref:winged helix-turn-helix transcriptional regulator n=1 Tax=Chitinophaga sp. Hz27 TaxID=3347169 RepID=UPI0035E37D90
MYTRKIEIDQECGIFMAMKALGGKWKLCVLDAVAKGISRPSEIARFIPDASARVIEMQLAEMLQYGLVDKFTADVYPKKSEYRLTPFGESFLPILNSIDKWGMEHAARLSDRMAGQEPNAA